jgi:signal transduction histidine kinase
VAVTLEPHARDLDIAVAVEAPDAEVASDCDLKLLEDVLLGLGGNALRLVVRREERRAILEVAATGPGIPEGVRDRVFDLFFTTRPDGTGLGLATVKKIIESHGATVEVAYTGPSGTAFRIELPAASL